MTAATTIVRVTPVTDGTSVRSLNVNSGFIIAYDIFSSGKQPSEAWHMVSLGR
jgi:hypothetical protein